MESLVDKIELFLSHGSGDGYGSGDGSGYGDGYGDGSGDGSGDGDGSGSGTGSGSGSSSSSGLSSLNGESVHVIDGVKTIIRSVRGNIARGFILGADLSLEKTYVAKAGSFFGHGATVREATEAATAKQLENAEPEERVASFLLLYPASKSYTGHELFEMHNILTGSCEQGRTAFVKDHSIDLDKSYTLLEFCKICKHAYGSDVIAILLDVLRAEAQS